MSIDDTIDDLGSVAQSEWAMRALRKVTNIPISDMEPRIVFYLGSLERLSAKDVERHRQYVHRVLNDVSAPVQDRYQQIIERLLEIGGRRLVIRFARFEIVEPRAGTGGTSLTRPRRPANDGPQQLGSESLNREDDAGDELR